MSENGEIYTAGNKFYTPAGTDGMDKFHLWVGVGWFFVNERQLSIFSISSTVGCIRGDHYHDRGGKK